MVEYSPFGGDQPSDATADREPPDDRQGSDGRSLLADPDDYRANCGVGVVTDLANDGGHGVLADGLELLSNLEHRGTTGRSGTRATVRASCSRSPTSSSPRK